MNFTLELVVVPVTDVDKSKDFYENKMGFTVDVDFSPNDDFRVVQLTPPGSACSITIGKGVSDPSSAGLYKGMHLCVNDIAAARKELVDRGVEVSEPYHFGETGRADGAHPERELRHASPFWAEIDGPEPSNPSQNGSMPELP